MVEANIDLRMHTNTRPLAESCIRLMGLVDTLMKMQNFPKNGAEGATYQAIDDECDTMEMELEKHGVTFEEDFRGQRQKYKRNK